MIDRLTAALLLSTALCAFAYESIEELEADFNTKKLAAIQAYISEHPEADDTFEALNSLIASLIEQDRLDEAIAPLQQQYAMLLGEDEKDMGRLFGETVAPLAHVYSQLGKREEAKAFFAKVRGDLKDHPEFEDVDAALTSMEGEMFAGPGIGDTLEIAFTALDGSEIDLAKLSADGKVVLVDFWATWCMPCVVELPHVKAAYDQYQGQGFEIVGISLDSSKEKLQAFLKDKQIAWPQHFDGKGWENELAVKYGISSIPATFLVGKDGKIAATNLRGDALAKAVAGQLAADR